ncbi:MAG: hypothetical protein ABIR38_07335 [Chthoniobacterales bacterium]
MLATASAGDTITFGLANGSEINLTSGELLIDKSITITGPGADRLTVQRSFAPTTAAFRIFRNDSGSNSTISGLSGRKFPAILGGGRSIENALDKFWEESLRILVEKVADELGAGVVKAWHLHGRIGVTRDLEQVSD